MIGFDFWVQLFVLLACLFYAAPRGGMTLGLMGGIGLIIFIFGFGLKPGKPPVDVILTIMAVVCAGATLQAAGGLDCLLSIAEKILRNHPRFVCYLAPYLCWFLTVLCGTGHVVYTMLPIIYDVAIKNNIRPERPMAASTIAAQMGVICSPAAVAAVSMVALLDGQLVGGQPFSFPQLFAIVIPAAIVGLFMVGTFSVFRGKDLDKDEKFQALIADPEQRKYVYGETTTLIGVKFTKQQWASLWIFLCTVAVVAVLGSVPELRPMVGKKRLSMTLVIHVLEPPARPEGRSDRLDAVRSLDLRYRAAAGFQACELSGCCCGHRGSGCYRYRYASRSDRGNGFRRLRLLHPADLPV